MIFKVSTFYNPAKDPPKLRNVRAYITTSDKVFPGCVVYDDIEADDERAAKKIASRRRAAEEKAAL